MKAKVYFKTFGCRTNLFDTQAMISALGDAALAQSEADADAIVINSCTVTNHADSAVRAYARRMRRERPETKILFTGCGAASQGRALLARGEIDGVFGHSEKRKISSFLRAEKAFESLGRPDAIDDMIVPSFDGKTRAFVKIQEGCDFACSYCVIPQARGRARSMSESVILEQIRRLRDGGFEEFVLTGTNTGGYGLDRGETLAGLIAKIGAIDGVKRIRLGSIEPVQIDSQLLDLLAAPFMAKQLHIALQHTSDRILELMNRRNRFESDRELLENVARRGAAIGTDFIVGFPGETDAIFEEALERIKLLPLTHIHIFPFSPREGTAAAKMKDRVSGTVANSRRREIVKIIDEKRREFYVKNKEPLSVLIEKDNSGLDQFFSRVFINADRELSGWINIDRYSFAEDGKIIAESWRQ